MLSVVTFIAVLLGVAKGQNNDLNALYLTTLNMTHKNPTWLLMTPACQWFGVGCDDSGRVVQIAWSGMLLGGTANLTALPSGLQRLGLGDNSLSGTPDLALLPQGLQVFDVSVNQLTGTPNLSALPKGLQQLDFAYNQLTGQPSFATLPKDLQFLDVSNNNFNGSGTFTPDEIWCSTPQAKMCGATDGTFVCTAGVWNC